MGTPETKRNCIDKSEQKRKQKLTNSRVRQGSRFRPLAECLHNAFGKAFRLFVTRHGRRYTAGIPARGGVSSLTRRRRRRHHWARSARCVNSAELCNATDGRNQVGAAQSG